MARLIFLVLAVALVYWLLRNFRKPAPPRDVGAAGENIVSCARCGLNLPRSEAIADGERYYCSEAHRREARPE